VDLTVAVTGGARGIGLAVATAFATAGARVVLGDIDLDAAAAAAERIGAAAHRVDVRDLASFEAFVAAVGPLDVLVNNAGVAPAGQFLDQAPALRDLQIDVNLRGVVNGMAAALPGMVERGGGHVVNIASLAGRVATPGAAVYTATKFAVVGLTEAVRAELHHSRVRLTAVCPTFVRTEMTAGLPLAGIPVIDPEDVARTVLRIVRARHTPAAVVVPRWLAGLPRAMTFTPSRVVDRIRGRRSRPYTDPEGLRAAYDARVRALVDPVDVTDGTPPRP
jgi:NADP-dependent 3-hydroxy acid dehydrogenase YdfG